ncbi:hypothetical protein DFJ74DRAFT_685554 [Hyaloraphidium curvatum]|nr:hypothetical protein DFJ74DRAFT_685554 [Hyaloraphidium curvatum]
MPAALTPYVGDTTAEDWRKRPGFLSAGESTAETVHVLMGTFLRDRHSPSPLPERDLFSDGQFEWGLAAPLEKVIRSRGDLLYLLENPRLARTTAFIIEPWEHVGVNRKVGDPGEDVQASKNAAFVLQTIADCDSVLFPLWKTGVIDPELVVPLFSAGLAVIIEGGDPSVQKAETFSHPKCPRDDVFALVEGLLVARGPISAPQLYICLGHQLAAKCNLRLVRRAVKEIEACKELLGEAGAKALKSLKHVAGRIKEVGEKAKVTKGDGTVAADGWMHTDFAVTKNEVGEVGRKTLIGYETPEPEDCGLPLEVLEAHRRVADRHEGVIDTAVQYEKNVEIAMFHNDEVNQEAILFVNWAFNLLHDACTNHRSILAGSALSWLLGLPMGIEILCSTSDEQGNAVTEVSATCIYYEDHETKRVRRSFSCQFHPELMEDLREMGRRGPVSYAELKDDDGIRLFTRLLYAGMQD